MGRRRPSAPVHERQDSGYGPGMTPPQDPDRGDPTDQSGRPLLITGAIVALMVVLALLIVVYVLST